MRTADPQKTRIGSPPLARGTVRLVCTLCARSGITPACAGNSKALALCARITGDHPRLRGEQQSRDLSVPQIRGSPPLARGTARILRKLYGPRGITPACAGNSGIYGVFYGDFWDHPRLRGEQRTKSPSRSVSVISPPLARGTAQDQHSDWEYRGITPACAGNRCGQRICPQSARDHPRLRGEQTFSNIEQQSAEGSPPLARGTVAAAWPVPPCQRITPACAGNSSAFVFSSSACWDHPRLRGEQRHI